MADIDLELFELPALTSFHRSAAQGLSDVAGGMPNGFDGGDVTARLMAILESVCKTSDDLAQLNGAVAEQLTHVVTDFDGAERQVAASFDRFTGPEDKRASQ
ncbi:MAG: hypothetical protein L0H93_08315 [Nocardioides sp.]|nr:hypothetical protein [Nocardioides sp.]